MTDEYKTLANASEEVLLKDRNSKFYGYAFPITSEQEAQQYLDDLRSKHSQANHCCYAYKLGVDEPNIIYRANDDGEPNNSAGMPIYGQIVSYDITNVLVAVVRYFGGTKLGVGGLVTAYKSTADMALATSKIEKKWLSKILRLEFGYDALNGVMRVLKENDINILANESGLNCKILVSERLSKVNELKEKFSAIPTIKFVEVEN